VSEVLLQRTKAETVARFWPEFVRRFPSWQSLAASSVSEIEEVLKPIGMSKQRAPRLFALARIASRWRGRFPKHRDALEELPGVGQYIANAILLFCYREEQPLLDVNMARVIERFFGPRLRADLRYDPYLQRLAKGLVSHGSPIQINWAVLDFAALVCRSANPLCALCVMRDKCRFFAITAQHQSCSGGLIKGPAT
jgi:A/G-specific adenine glycosylase